jgi:hypothetical protein
MGQLYVFVCQTTFNVMYIQYLREVFFPSVQIFVKICKHITILIF